MLDEREAMEEGPLCGIPFSSASGRVIIVRVGNDSHRASEADIEHYQDVFAKAFKGVDCRIVVIPHEVKVEVI